MLENHKSIKRALGGEAGRVALHCEVLLAALMAHMPEALAWITASLGEIDHTTVPELKSLIEV